MPLNTPFWWSEKGLIPSLLQPVAACYGAVTIWRARQASPQRLSVPVICIGNAVAGGAGKTPLALAIGQWLKARQVQAAFVTRGYGGSETGPLRVDSSRHTAAQVGDEALLLARPLPTFVGRDRLAAARMAIAQGARMLVLDDGLQNYVIEKTFSFLVVDGEFGFGNGLLLPAGPLRESAASAMEKAQAVVVIGGSFQPETSNPILRAALKPSAEAGALRGKNIFGFAGLGRPEKFRCTLEEMGCVVTGFQGFSDHHPYREKELEALQARAQAQNAVLVTTEKDAVRLPEMWRARVTVIPVQLQFAQPEILHALLEPLCA